MRNGKGGPHLQQTRQVGERCPCCGTMTVGIIELSCVVD
jgi:hypothetical protein